MSPEWMTTALWFAWLVSWIIAAFWSSRIARRGGWTGEIFLRGLIYLAAVLMFALVPNRGDYPQIRLWKLDDVLKWLLAATTAAGLSFAWWARIHLGRLWSSWGMAKKANHRVVDTGPYCMVRHPIYSGLLFAAFATSIEKGTAAAMLGAAILTLALYLRARREERFLRAELPEGAYDTYARKTPMLLPSFRHNRISDAFGL